MNTEPTPNTGPAQHPSIRASLLSNWVSLSGLVVVAGSLFSFLLLFALDSFAPSGNPYIGLLAYLISPAFLVIGLGLMVLGLLVQRRQRRRLRLLGLQPLLMVDLSRPRDRRNLFIFVLLGGLFLLLSAIGSYRSYHFTESVQFCGQACHEVMKPEFTTYLHSPHARVSCSECHIGPGATWYVKAKISGLYQVYATLFNKYPRPIKTPISNLRPAQETCERCHWPQKFVGNLDRTYTHFLTDSTNTPYSVRLLLKVGGGDPTHGPVSGIHWHMSVANKVEYIATDAQHQVIPWVRMTDPQGVVTEFNTPDFKGDARKQVIRTMDCMDCHNRPSHIFQTPNEAVDLALELGRLDTSMLSIKKEAVAVLTQPYATEDEAKKKIATTLHAKYTDHPRLKSTIEEVQRIYTNNFFPEMKAGWKVYPRNIGHKDWAGCFRCHDGRHKSADGKQAINANDCNSCHVILAEGRGSAMEQLNPQGLKFKHPEEGWEGMKCNDCHTGGN
ncbi:MAG: cytochrome c3 family protein [Limisphaerales bacterium]